MKSNRKHKTEIMPLWMIERKQQIYDRVCIFLVVVFLILASFAFGCIFSYNNHVYGAPQTNIKDTTSNGLYAGFTNENWLSYELSLEHQERQIVTSSETESGETKYSNEEYELLAKLIYRETGNQGWNCMVACGSVVMNRVNSNKYPNTIKGVIFQKGQYSVTFNRKRFYNTKPSDDAYLVAELILNEGSQIPKNVLYQSQSKLGSSVWKVINGEVYSYE